MANGESWITIHTMAAQAQQRQGGGTQIQLGLAAMTLMGIQLSLLMVAAFCLLCLGVLYDLYLGFLVCRFASFILGGPGALDGNSSSLMELCKLLVASVVVATHSGAELGVQGEHTPHVGQGQDRCGG